MSGKGGKGSRARRKKRRDEEKKKRRQSNRERYAALVGTEANKKKKGGDARSSGLRKNRKRVRRPRMDDTRSVYKMSKDGVFRKVSPTWKQTHNTMSLKQFLKSLK